MLRFLCFLLLVAGTLAQDCDKTFEECLAEDEPKCKALTEAKGLGVECLQVHKFQEGCECTCTLLRDPCNKDPTETTEAPPTDGDGDGGDPDEPLFPDEGGSDGGGEAPPPATCFHGDGVVITDKGAMSLKDLANAKTTDVKVEGVNEEGELVMADFMMWLDKQFDATAGFLDFTTESGHMVSMTPQHVAHEVPCSGGPRTVKLAEKLNVGECVLVRQENGEMIPSRIQNIQESTKTGYFAFVTSTDAVVVNGVAASTFTTTEHEALQRYFFNMLHAFMSWMPAPVQDFCYEAFENPAKFIFAQSHW